MQDTATTVALDFDYRHFFMVTNDYREDGDYANENLTQVGPTYLRVFTGHQWGDATVTFTTHAHEPELPGDWERVAVDRVEFGGELRVSSPTCAATSYIDTGSPGPLMIRVAGRGRDERVVQDEEYLIQIWEVGT